MKNAPQSMKKNFRIDWWLISFNERSCGCNKNLKKIDGFSSNEWNSGENESSYQSLESLTKAIY